MNNNILAALLERRGTLVLDGAMATELERAGCDLDHALWSARILLDTPQRISAVHRDYLEAGCDIIASVNYQASVPGFVAQGLSEDAARDLFREAIRIAGRERDAFAQERALEPAEQPLVAVSLGPYGAYLADGSEYRGRYAASSEELERFHRERLELAALELRAGNADLVACETLPSLPEARLIAGLLDELELPGWIAFACRDSALTCEGQAIAECARALEEHPYVVGVGINCTPPQFVPALLEGLRGATSKPLLAYPNSGEQYQAATHSWTGENVLSQVEGSTALWHAAGARVLGGCCRSTPENIAQIAAWRDARG